MSNHGMPSTETRPGSDRAETDRSVSSIAGDFAALVEVFDRQLKLAALSDPDTRSHISRAKEADERGVRLSRELIERIRFVK